MGGWGWGEGRQGYHHLGSSLHGCSAPGPAGVELLMHLLCKYLIIHPILFFVFFTVYIAVLRTADGPYCKQKRGWQKRSQQTLALCHSVRVPMWLGGVYL